MTSISNYSEAKYAPVRVSFIFILLFNFVLESCLKSSVSYSDKNESVNTDVDFCGGSGTVSDPYLICDQASLVELQNKFLNTPDYILYADKYYKQTSDITLTGNTLDVIGASIENNFNTSTPSVAPTSKPFNGSYDGNNKSISAFSLSKSASDYNALFRHLGSFGIIKNLILHTPTLSLTDTSNMNAILVAYNEGTISNITIDQAVITFADGEYTSALVAYNKGTIENSSISGSITQTGNCVGQCRYFAGAIGTSNGGSVSNLNVSVDIESTSGLASVMGGVVGYAHSSTTLDDINYSAGTLTGGLSHVGGLVGVAADSTLSNSSFSGTINLCKSYVGGLIGFATTSNLEGNHILTGSSITNASSIVGGMLGEIQGSFFTESVSNNVIDGITISNVNLDQASANANVGGIAGKFTGGLISYNTVNTSISQVSSQGDANVGGVFGTDTSALDTEVRNNIITTNIEDVTGSNTGGIGGASNSTYAGDNQVTVTLNTTGDYTGGLFGFFDAQGADNNTVAGSIQTSGNYTGGFAGKMMNNLFPSGNTSSVNITTNSNYVGGFAGIMESSYISSNSSSGTISGDGSFRGGLIGSMTSGSISNSSSSVAIIHKGATSLGGLVGEFVSGSISQSYSSGSITWSALQASANHGGLIGLMGSYSIATTTSLDNSYSTSNVTCSGHSACAGLIAALGSSSTHTITNVYSTGRVTGMLGKGLVGGVAGTVSATSLYWDTTTSGKATSNLGIGYSTVGMQTAGTYLNWDFNTIWNSPSVGVYPTLINTP